VISAGAKACGSQSLCGHSVFKCLRNNPINLRQNHGGPVKARTAGEVSHS